MADSTPKYALAEATARFCEYVFMWSGEPFFGSLIDMP